MDTIQFFAEDIDFTLPAPAATTAWLRQVIQQEGYALTHLNIIFCTDQYLHAHNLAYLQHDTLTDVLSFDHSDGNGHLEGDIYISLERVQENALAMQVSWLQELHTVMVHGVLHLLGYDDHAPADRTLMRQKEDFYRRLAPLQPPTGP